MNIKYKVIILTIVIIIIIRAIKYLNKPELEIKEAQNVRVSVYYEALCPDSKFFITSKLLPVYEKLKDYMILDLVPYGKAQTLIIDGKYAFICQHDKRECDANKVHSCVINYVKDPEVQLRFIACMIADNVDAKDALERCAEELKVPTSNILECAEGELGSTLLAGYGKRTHSLSPSVTFIPTIELNGSQSLVSQSVILKDLLNSVCQLLFEKPEVCP